MINRDWPSSHRQKGVFQLQAITIVSIIITTVLLHLSGVFASFDQWDLDFAMRNQSIRPPVSSIIVISADSNGWPIEEESLKEINLKLSAAKPSAIVYTFHIPSSLQKQIEESGVAAVYPSNSALISGGLISDSIQLYSSNAAIAIPTPSIDGIHRKQQLIFHTEHGFEASLPLAALVAAKVADPIAKIRNGQLYTGSLKIPIDQSQKTDIFFIGPPQSHPYISLTKILNGEFPLTLLTGKILFVGPTNPSTSRMLLTPTAPPERPISETEYWAEVTNTLVEGRVKNSISTYHLIIILSCVVFLGGLIFRRLNPLAALSLLLILLLSTWFFSNLAFDRFNFQIPFTAIRVGLILSLISITMIRLVIVYSSLSKLLLRLKLRERGTLALSGEINEYNWWERAADVVSHYLDIESQIFFEKLPIRKHLQIACLRGLASSEIVERRRDFTRAPYATASESGSPIFVQGFLSGDRSVMMIPLAFGQRILGYWVIARHGGQQYFKSQSRLISLLAKELSISLLYYKITKKPIGFFDLPQLEEIFSRFSALEDLIEELMRERELLSSVLDSESDGVAACDPLGRVLVYNSVLIEILSALKIDLNVNDLFSTVCQLTKIDEADLRVGLYGAIFNKRELILNLNAAEETNMSYRLTFRAVSNSSDGTESIRGFVLTLVNTVEYKEFDSMKSQLIDNIFALTQNYLTPIIGYGELLHESKTMSEEDRSMVSIIASQAKQLANIFRKTSSIAEIDLQSSLSGLVPVNMIQLLKSVIEDLNYKAEQREIKINFDHPFVINTILCSKNEILDSLVSILSFFIDLIPPGSNLLVRLIERNSDIKIIFEVENFSLPSNMIEKIFEESELEGNGELVQAKRIFLSHNGTFQLESCLKEGTILEVTIPKAWSTD